ncbi:autotransporter outer membrane beta-barrel domain-containing protein [Oxalobacter formigenes]
MLTGALYGTWHNQDGDYLDLIGKLSGMHNKYKVISDDNSFTTKASNSNWAYSISAEYGKRFQEKTYGYFVEPQIQLTLGRIEGSDYRTNNGIQVGQDSIDSVIGRVGLAFGRKLEKGSYFVRVDGLREFNGKGGAIFQETGGTPNRSRIDFRDTWGEVSLGGTWKLDEKSFGYAQLKRSFSADIQTEYRVDVGYRHIFD